MYIYLIFRWRKSTGRYDQMRLKFRRNLFVEFYQVIKKAKLCIAHDSYLSTQDNLETNPAAGEYFVFLKRTKKFEV